MRILTLLLLLSIITMPAMAKQPVTSDVIQTIPPIVVSGPNAVAGCTVLNLAPGSAISGTSGFIKADCPNGIPGIILHGTETPMFLLATGFVQISLMYYTTPCSYNFIQYGRLVGLNLTSSGPVTMTNLSNSTSHLLAGGYNYCLFYQNPPVNGILSFTISWTP